MEVNKERLSVLLCFNMTTTDKIKLLIIGKSKKPRYFKYKLIPVCYKANSKAWTTSDIFSDWLKIFDNNMFCQNRKMLLIVDNCPHTQK